MSDAIIQVKNVSKDFIIPHERLTSLKENIFSAFKPKSYEVFHALKDVSFEVKRGEFLGIIGRNGSGKSTLLKILAKVYEPDSGEVIINGKVSPFLELGVGFNGELTARENIYLNGTILGLSKKKIDSKFEKIIQFAELEKFVDSKVKNFSSGMYARLAFSVAIEAEADIYIMDEVLAVGDANFQQKCMEKFFEYKNKGKTVILVSHDINAIQDHCDRAFLLVDGEIIINGDVKDVTDVYVGKNIEDKEIQNNQAKVVDGDNLETEEVAKKDIEITGVEFLDKDLKKKSVFRTGEDMSVRVYFRTNEKREDINFILALYSQQNVVIFASNTITDEIDTKKFLEKGYYQMNFPNLKLKNGSYYAEAIIIDQNFRHLDFLGKSNEFSIVSTRNTRGLVELEYEWGV